jgi:hypothetical protein
MHKYLKTRRVNVLIIVMAIIAFIVLSSKVANSIRPAIIIYAPEGYTVLYRTYYTNFPPGSPGPGEIDYWHNSTVYIHPNNKKIIYYPSLGRGSSIVLEIDFRVAVGYFTEEWACLYFDGNATFGIDSSSVKNKPKGKIPFFYFKQSLIYELGEKITGKKNTSIKIAKMSPFYRIHLYINKYGEIEKQETEYYFFFFL